MRASGTFKAIQRVRNHRPHARLACRRTAPYARSVPGNPITPKCSMQVVNPARRDEDAKATMLLWLVLFALHYVKCIDKNPLQIKALKFVPWKSVGFGILKSPKRRP